jgi:hypothetical protein
MPPSSWTQAAGISETLVCFYKLQSSITQKNINFTKLH